jgi:hypothetical protein
MAPPLGHVAGALRACLMHRAEIQRYPLCVCVCAHRGHLHTDIDVAPCASERSGFLAGPPCDRAILPPDGQSALVSSSWLSAAGPQAPVVCLARRPAAIPGWPGSHSRPAGRFIVKATRSPAARERYPSMAMLEKCTQLPPGVLGESITPYPSSSFHSGRTTPSLW